MNINISPSNGIVIYNGRILELDLSSMDQNIQGLSWDGTDGVIVYWNKNTRKMLSSEELKDFSEFEWIADKFEVEWQALLDKEEAERKAAKEAAILPDALYKRDSLLQSSDWTQLSDVPLTIEEKEQWSIYRQLLRDVTLQSGFPNIINWPTPPNANQV